MFVKRNLFANENNNQNIRIVEKIISHLNDLFYLSQRTLRHSFRNRTLTILQTVV